MGLLPLVKMLMVDPVERRTSCLDSWTWHSRKTIALVRLWGLTLLRFSFVAKLWYFPPTSSTVWAPSASCALRQHPTGAACPTNLDKVGIWNLSYDFLIEIELWRWPDWETRHVQTEPRCQTRIGHSGLLCFPMYLNPTSLSYTIMNLQDFYCITRYITKLSLPNDPDILDI
jgi:hypothetical protein